MKDELKHKEKFLKSLTNGESGFTVSESYFNGLENVILNSYKQEKHLSKTEGFDIPPSYFENLENEIIAKIKERPTKIISLKKRLIKWIPAAAIITLFLIIQFSQTKKSELTNEEIISWLQNETESSITQEDFILAFETSDFADTDWFSSLSDNSIEEYLTNQDINSLLYD